MTSQSRLRVVVVLALSAFLGCNWRTPQLPPSFKGIADPGTTYLKFNPERKDKRVPGLDEATVGFLRWGSDKLNEGEARVALLVWTDVVDGNYGMDGTGPNSEGATGEYRFTMGKDKQLVITCKTSDGATGPVTVNGEQFDLSGGSIILVSAAGGQVRTRQLKREALKLAPTQVGGMAEYEKFSREPEVRAFFAKEK
jgi:hypothetical protein